MGLGRFLVEWVKVAATHDWKMAPRVWSAVTLILAMCGYLASRIPALDPTAGRLAWLIPLIAFAVLGALRLILAPYWIYREAEERARSLAGQVSTVEKTQDVRESLGQLLKEGNEIAGRCITESLPVPNDWANKWAAKTETFLRERIGESYVIRFRSSSGLPVAVSNIQSAEHRKLWANLRTRLARLELFLQELSD